jgi:hypothetical protein
MRLENKAAPAAAADHQQCTCARNREQYKHVPGISAATAAATWYKTMFQWRRCRNTACGELEVPQETQRKTCTHEQAAACCSCSAGNWARTAKFLVALKAARLAASTSKLSYLWMGSTRPASNAATSARCKKPAAMLLVVLPPTVQGGTIDTAAVG